MSKTLIIGDLHLGKTGSLGKPGYGTIPNSRIADQIKLLDWILSTAIEKNVENIILTGDVCEDSRPDFTIINIFLNFLKQCETYNIEVHIVMGNHDFKRTGMYYISFLDLIASADLSNVFIYTQTSTIQKEGVGFTFLPFRDRRSFDVSYNEALTKLSESLPYELAEISDQSLKVLIGHMALEGSIHVGDEIDDVANELMCPLSMFEGYDYVWMGHIHKPQVRKQQPYLAHIGSLDLSDFGEADHTKILVLFDPACNPPFTEIPVPSRPLIDIDIKITMDDLSTANGTTNFVLNTLQEKNNNKPFQNAIVRLSVRLIGPEVSGLDRPTVESYIYSLGAFYLCGFSEIRQLDAVELNKEDAIENTIAPKSAIKIWAEKNIIESERENYLQMANEIIEQYVGGLK